MKKLLILTTFLSSLIMSSVAYAKWTEIGKNVYEAVFYVDLERIKKHKGRVYYWELTNFLKPNKYGVASSKVYTEAECGLFRTRWLNQTYYKGAMGEGTILHSNHTPQKDWTYPAPDTTHEIVLKVVCNHKTMQ